MIEIYQIKTEYEHYKISIASYESYKREFYNFHDNEKGKKDLYIRISSKYLTYWVKMPKRLFFQRKSDRKIFFETLGSLLEDLATQIDITKKMEFNKAVNLFQGRNWL